MLWTDCVHIHVLKPSPQNLIVLEIEPLGDYVIRFRGGGHEGRAPMMDSVPL